MYWFLVLLCLCWLFFFWWDFFCLVFWVFNWRLFGVFLYWLVDEFVRVLSDWLVFFLLGFLGNFVDWVNCWCVRWCCVCCWFFWSSLLLGCESIFWVWDWDVLFCVCRIFCRVFLWNDWMFCCLVFDLVFGRMGGFVIGVGGEWWIGFFVCCCVFLLLYYYVVCFVGFVDCDCLFSC